MNKCKVLIVFGTRPEAIKMVPVIKEFLKYPDIFDIKVCNTAQHRGMLDQVLDFFEIIPDFDLNLMKANQNLYSLTASIITGLQPVLEEFKPKFVFVHGDTTTTLGASIASFYSGAKVCHIEAGLRTFNKQAPFPEEMNRCVTSSIAEYHFAPTLASKNNLLNENINPSKIIVTGNTVIDTLLYSAKKVSDNSFIDDEIFKLKKIIYKDRRLILVTGHRRENHGTGFINICAALKEIALASSDIYIIYPVHLNPNVQKPVYELLAGIDNIQLIEPLGYPAFVWLMDQSYLIITDSGGVQEEAPSLRKPVLVMRETTERPEAVNAGTAILVGTDKEKIVSETLTLLNDKEKYKKMSLLHNPYGDGTASKRILEVIRELAK